MVSAHASNCPQTYLNKLLVLQKRALRLIYFAKPGDHAIPFFLLAQTALLLACENIRFSSLFASGDVSPGGTSPVVKSEDKRIFWQATFLYSLCSFNS